MSWAEDAKYRQEVFDLILFIASEEGMKPIPSGETEVLLEMVVRPFQHRDQQKVIQIPQELNLSSILEF